MASLTAAFGSLSLSSRQATPAELRCSAARAAPLRAAQRCSVVVAADAAEVRPAGQERRGVARGLSVVKKHGWPEQGVGFLWRKGP
jgi:hypothetical protein